MITTILIICHAFRRNERFQPEWLYLGTVLLDWIIFEALLGC